MMIALVLGLPVVAVLVIKVGTSVPTSPDEGDDVNWIPESNGDCQPEVRDIPVPRRVVREFEEWEKSDGEYGNKYFRLTLALNGKQTEYEVKHYIGGSPLGNWPATLVSFMYETPEGHRYRLTWNNPGTYSADFLRLDSRLRDVLLVPSSTPTDPSPVPTLSIHAIERVQANTAVICVPKRPD